MKSSILTAFSGVVLALSLQSPAQAEELSYTAVQKSADSEVFCARVKVQHVGNTSGRRTKCRTLAQWENAGYVVTQPERVAAKHQEEEING